jgi:DnaJ-domain-containing protein 1
MGLIGAGVGALLGARGGLVSSLIASFVGSYAEDKIRDKIAGEKRTESAPPPVTPPAGGDDPYVVLGCSRADSDEKVRAAYLAKVRKLHPDVLESKDIPDELRTLANAEMVRVNAAWESVKAQRPALD